MYGVQYPKEEWSRALLFKFLESQNPSPRVIRFAAENFTSLTLRLQVFAFVISNGKTCLYSKGILRVREVTLSAPNRITWGERFYELQKFEQKSPTPLLFGVLHSMHGHFQVMKFLTSMELRMFESGLQMLL